MKIKLIAELEYEVSDETAFDNYGTTDPQECMHIDLENLELYGFDSHVGPDNKATYRAEVTEF